MIAEIFIFFIWAIVWAGCLLIIGRALDKKRGQKSVEYYHKIFRKGRRG